MKTIRFFSAVLIALASVLQTVHAATINFSGQLDYILADTGAGIYSGADFGDTFFGEIDDVTFSGFISDGITSTPFSCCTLAAGGLEITNDVMLDADGVAFLNALVGMNQFMAGDVVDIVDIEGDALTSTTGRIEVGLSYVLDSGAFPNEDPANYPFDPADVEVALFFILEQNEGGEDIFSGGGLVTTPIPLPGAIWLLFSGIVLLLGRHKPN